ncbi:carboxylesterase family protein [Chitinophaga lutea]
MKFLLMLHLLLAGPGQPDAYKPMTLTSVRITPWHQLPALIYLPDEAKTPGKKFPLIITLHGRSIAGKDPAKIFREGVARQVREGKKIEGKDPAGKHYKFIVLAPLAESWSLGPEHLESALDDVLKRYPVDPSRVYITGYSAGGWSVGMAVTTPSLAKRLAGAVNMSPATIDDKNLASFKVTADANLHVWYFGGEAEPVFLGNCHRFADSTNRYREGLTRMTIGSHGHCCWHEYYDPHWKENGESIYDWLLRFKR